MATILIIASEPNLRRWYRDELASEGYQVLTARDLTEALRRVEAQPIDIALLDVQLTNGNGLECLQQMLKHQRYMKIIISTSCPFFAHDFDFWLADRFVLKSSDLSTLKKEIAELLAQTDNSIFELPEITHAVVA
jgi:DNA-binding response OmpR family regulator